MRPRASVAACLLLASMLVACGDDSTSSGTEAVTTPSAASAPEDDTAESAPTTAPVTTPTTPPPPPTTPPPPPTTTPPTTPPTTAAPTTTVEPDAAPCTSDAILPVVAGLFPDNDRWNILEVDIERCQNGYTRVIAIADQSICDPDTPICLENEQVFLEDVDGAWEYFESGTGIECHNPSALWPEMIVVCEALGLS